MGEPNVEQSYNSATSNNLGYQAASALHYRLDVTPLLEDIEMFLKGEIIELDLDTGLPKRVTKGIPRANPIGIQSILQGIRMVINSATVQGNWAVDNTGHSEQYENFIEMFRLSQARTIIMNCYQWDIKEEDMEFIIDSTMNLIKPYLTRLIGNKEREGYANNMRIIENNTLKENPATQGFKLFQQ